jgi:carboxymethylenebutenolidase
MKITVLRISTTIVLLLLSLRFATTLSQQGAPGRGGQRGGDAQGRGDRGGAPRGGGLANKVPELPAGAFTASSTVARTNLRHEWVDIPLGKVKVHTWIEYPNNLDKAPIVVVMQHAAGLDDWMRALADQLALQGFIAIAPDILSGMGPNNGNFDSFRFPDDAIKAMSRVKSEEAVRRYRAAWDYGMKLPQSSGKGAALGVGIGGSTVFELAADIPGMNAAVVFYGSAPGEAVLARIKAPVLGIYGDQDLFTTPTVETTASTMKRLGKTFESHIYPGATQEFMRSQAEGQNGAATGAAWPVVIAFLQMHLK